MVKCLEIVRIRMIRIFTYLLKYTECRIFRTV